MREAKEKSKRENKQDSLEIAEQNFPIFFIARE
jgi:hypothetical protein